VAVRYESLGGRIVVEGVFLLLLQASENMSILRGNVGCMESMLSEAVNKRIFVFVIPKNVITFAGLNLCM
jgi:hypothetical protein